MIDMFILAEVTGKYDISGVLCLAAIPVLILALIPFSKGVISGSATNCIFFFIFVLCMADPETAEDGAFVNAVANNDSGYISNSSQTKWTTKDSPEIMKCMGTEGAMLFVEREGTWGIKEDQTWVLSYDEIREIRDSGRDVEDDDYWIYSKVYPTVNAPLEIGGDGIPQWLYHPACLTYITGFFALPTLGLGALIIKKLL